MYDLEWSEKQNIANEMMIANFIKILSDETLKNLYTPEELREIANAVRCHSLLQAKTVQEEFKKIDKSRTV